MIKDIINAHGTSEEMSDMYGFVGRDFYKTYYLSEEGNVYFDKGTGVSEIPASTFNGEKVINIKIGVGYESTDMDSYPTFNTVYLTEEGNVYIETDNSSGITFEKLAGEMEGKVIKDTIIDSSANNIWCIDRNNELYIYGKNNYGQLGTGDTSEVTSPQNILSQIEKIVCNSNSTWYRRCICNWI